VLIDDAKALAEAHPQLFRSTVRCVLVRARKSRALEFSCIFASARAAFVSVFILSNESNMPMAMTPMKSDMMTHEVRTM